ncbi:MAG: 4a-hydroxytetrahydrobiopterin dehydratase [Nitriliruptoraceae bacterium]
MDTLDAQTIADVLEEIEGWEHVDDGLSRQFVLDGFADAIGFIVRIGFAAESMNHHPELANVYDRVTVRLTSHDAGGVTERDVALARIIDALARRG